MRRRILAACMAMCMAAATVVTSPWGGGMTAYAAEAEDTRTITVSAYDYTAVDAGLEGASETGVIMEQKVTVDKDATTQQIVQKAFDEAGISVTMQNGSTETRKAGRCMDVMIHQQGECQTAGL